MLVLLVCFYHNNPNIVKTTNIEIIGQEKINQNNNDKKTPTRKVENNKEDYSIGKITINGTIINEEIVQGNDNVFFLNHSTDGKKNTIGSTFLDYRNNKYDRKILIYGHNSKTLNNIPFHDLEKYLNKSFLQKNKYVDLDLFGEKSKWEIFSVMIVKSGDNTHMKITFNDKEWLGHLNWMKKNSIYNTGVGVNLKDKVLTLQTCYYEPENSFILINAKKI